ncbi:MAG: SoxR reducing system RseC family protein [Alphaproteobacteria bacterium]|nr:SoxR reducing system RseC family protein [Alphaproteobacteria bacterium]
MDNMNNCKTPPIIENDGIIKSTDGDTIKVEVQINTACSNCDMKKGCSMHHHGTTRIIEVQKTISSNYHMEDHVTVIATMQTGTKAVIIAYIIPFILFMIALIASTKSEINELYCGILSITVVAIYYIALYFLKDKISKSVTFSIKE